MMSAICRRRSSFRSHGRIPQHARVAASRVDDPREHLDERRLAGAVGADKADDLALADSEANLAHRGLLDFLALE